MFTILIRANADRWIDMSLDDKHIFLYQVNLSTYSHDSFHLCISKLFAKNIIHFRTNGKSLSRGTNRLNCTERILDLVNKINSMMRDNPLANVIITRICSMALALIFHCLIWFSPLATRKEFWSRATMICTSFYRSTHEICISFFHWIDCLLQGYSLAFRPFLVHCQSNARHVHCPLYLQQWIVHLRDHMLQHPCRYSKPIHRKLISKKKHQSLLELLIHVAWQFL